MLPGDPTPVGSRCGSRCGGCQLHTRPERQAAPQECRTRQEQGHCAHDQATAATPHTTSPMVRCPSTLPAHTAAPPRPCSRTPPLRATRTRPPRPAAHSQRFPSPARHSAIARTAGASNCLITHRPTAHDTARPGGACGGACLTVSLFVSVVGDTVGASEQVGRCVLAMLD